MKKLLLSVVLGLAISLPALAGEIPSGDYQPPPPPPTNPATAGTNPGEIPSGDEQQQMSETIEAWLSNILGLLLR